MNPLHPQTQPVAILRKLRAVLAFFIVALILSGVTAFPIQRELEIASGVRGLDRIAPADVANSLDRWIVTVRDGLRESYTRHPWLGLWHGLVGVRPYSHRHIL